MMVKLGVYARVVREMGPTGGGQVSTRTSMQAWNLMAPLHCRVVRRYFFISA